MIVSVALWYLDEYEAVIRQFHLAMVSDRRHVCLYEHNKSVHVEYNTVYVENFVVF